MQRNEVMKDSPFMRMLITDRIKVVPSLIGTDLGDVIKSIVVKKYEGKCTQYGYTLPGSVQIYKYSAGHIIAASLNGDVGFTVMFHADVCNPLGGTIVKVKVVNMNKFGILGEYYVEKIPVIEVIIAKNASPVIASDVDLNSVKIGDILDVEVIRTKFELNDQKISAIGKVVNTSSSVSKKNLIANAEDDASDKDANIETDDIDDASTDDDEDKSDNESDEDKEDEDEEEDEEDEDNDDSEPTEGESSEEDEEDDIIIDDDESDIEDDEVEGISDDD